MLVPIVTTTRIEPKPGLGGRGTALIAADAAAGSETNFHAPIDSVSQSGVVKVYVGFAGCALARMVCSVARGG